MFTSRPDTVAGEEPLEIRIGGVPISTTMRTPGHDIELVHGLLHAEGIITGREDVSPPGTAPASDSAGQNTYNVLDVGAGRPGGRGRAGPRRGRSSPAPPAASAAPRPSRPCSGSPATGCRTCPLFDPAMISALPDRLRARQQAFQTTGGLHAAALVSPDGRIERRPGGRRPAQRDGQGDRRRAAGRRAADRRPGAARPRPGRRSSWCRRR